MGNVKKTIQNLEVIDIDVERNLIFIKGSIAGHDNSFVIVTPSIRGTWDNNVKPEEMLGPGGDKKTSDEDKKDES